MVSNQNTYGNYYLPDLSDVYNESSFLWQVPEEDAFISSSPETWKIPEDWFPDVKDTFSDEINLTDTQDMMKSYHPCLPPISVAFSIPPILTNYSNSKNIETLHSYIPNYPDEIQPAQCIEIDIDDNDSCKEILPSNGEDSLNYEYNEMPLIIAEDSVNDKEHEVAPDSCETIHITHHYRTVEGHKLKRRKTVRELLLEKQRCLSMQKFQIDSIVNESNVSGLTVEENKNHECSERSVFISVVKKDTVVHNKSSSTLRKGDVPKLRIGRVDAKEHRPRHYDIEELHIGKFIVRNEMPSSKKMLNRLKVLFSKRRFVYEFDINSEAENRLACIIVPFRTVSAINCSGSVVTLKVDSQPLMFLGSRQQGVGIITATNVYDKTQPVDITKGEIKHCPFHKLVLHKYQADKMKLYLWHFDGRFKVLTQLAFSEDSSNITTLLPPPDIENLAPKKIKKGPSQPFLIDETDDPEAAVLLSAAVVCACRTNCRSSKCSCVKTARRCNAGRSVCLCSNCDNPLNVLDSLGIDSTIASLDRCLLQNIYQLSDLRKYLMQDIKLECCKQISTVKNCIPGTVQCPNSNCHAKIQYSWCRGIATDDTIQPRNHCRFCGKCRFRKERHCTVCKKCYTVKSGNEPCPNCSGNSFQG